MSNAMIAVLGGLLVGTQMTVLGADEFSGLVQNAADLARQVQTAGGKVVAVVDFVDLQGKPVELGRALAEEMTTLLVREGKPLKVVTRTRIRAILQELKLTEEGVVRRENSRRLGEVSGVDTLFIGTLAPMGDKVRVNIQALSTASGEVIAASSASIERSEAVDRMLRFEAGSSSTTARDIGEYQGQRAVQRVQYLEMSLTSFEILSGGEIRATILFANVSRSGDKLAICLAAEGSGGIADYWKFFPALIGTVTDENGNKYRPSGQSGLGFCRTTDDWLIITAGSNATGVLSFRPSQRSTPGTVFSLSAEIRLVSMVSGKQQVSNSTMAFSNIRPKKP